MKVINYLGHILLHAEDVEGVRFAVWAPHARSVSVVGDFNNWNGKDHGMERIERSGIWVLFVPNLKEGDLYKFEIHTPSNKKILKADPFAFYSEVRPKTASVLKRLDSYSWNDSKWMANRKKEDFIIDRCPFMKYIRELGSKKIKKIVYPMKATKVNIIRIVNLLMN